MYFSIIKKVELVDLNGNTNEITLNHNYNSNSIINNHRQRSFSPLSTSSSSSSTDVLCQQQHQQKVSSNKISKSNINSCKNKNEFETKELFINPKLKSNLFLLNSIPNLTSIMNKSSASSSASHSPVAQSKSNTNNNYQLVDPNKIHLFVKAGQDGRSQGACPFCQDVFLQLLIKAQTNKFNFDVITINMDNPPKEFKELSIKPPVLIHGSSNFASSDSSSSGFNENVNAVILSDVDEIAEYLDRLYPNSKLVVPNSEAKRVCLNVFSKFSFFIRDVSSKSTYLEAELEKIDTYLRENTNEDNKFLNGSLMTALDCSLLPKLQHIRVAGESLKKFKIPSKFIHLWKYIDNAYHTDAFHKSCPPDREILWNWSKTHLSKKDLLQIMLEAPHKTLSIPNEMSLK
jgi:glutathione S-transferase